MTDDFAIGLTHLLMALAIWRLLRRPDLDEEPNVSAGGTTGASADEATPHPGRRRMQIRRA